MPVRDRLMHANVIRPAAQRLERRTLLAAVTLEFSDGSAGYAGTQDTHVRLDTPGGSFGGDAKMVVDLDDGAATGNQPVQGLLRFDSLFGPGPGQLPPGATITSATLTLRTGTVSGDSSTNTSSLHRMLRDWDEASTWDSLTGGVTANGVEAVATADGSVVPSVLGAAVNFNVATTLQAWSSDPASTLGWVLLGGSNGWGVASSESADPAVRPRLSVTYESGEPGVNQPPFVSAGPDRAVTMPSSAALDGTVSDDGLPNPPAGVTTTWSQFSGPGTVTFANASAVDTTASFSAPGTYVLRLTAGDGEFTGADDVTVTVDPEPPPNDPPSVNAGPDQTITLPSSATLDGTVTDDGFPNPPGAVTTTWSRFSGPGTVTFASASAVDTTASFSVAGTYVLRLTARDGALTRTDDLTVTVNPRVNQSPSVNAGPDLTVTLPLSATLNGTVTDDGLPNPPGAVTTAWSTFSGPGTVTFANASAVDTTAAFSAVGTYVLRLTASDGTLTGTDDVTVTVNPEPPPNDPPSVNAGPDQAITLPSSATLDGTVTDDGFPNPPGAVTASWSRFSGPGTVTFASASSVDTTASFSVAGTYVLRLTANDGGLIRTDDLTVTVNPRINQLPSVNAGPDVTITMPSSATLNGTVTDDGLPNPPAAVVTTWSQFSGPGTVTFANASAVDTTASFSVAGTYVLRLTASDGTLTGTDDATITVEPAPLEPTIQTLDPVQSTRNTGEKPQSKLWKHADTWWSVFPNSTGTWVWRLDNTTWNPVFRINTRSGGRADVFPADGGVVHVLLFDGSGSTRLASLQYVAGSPGTYQFWSQRTTVPTIPLTSGVEVATIAMDGAGRMWIASDGGSSIEVRYSDGNYATWSAPIALASVDTDDICDITTLPDGSVGVIWSNQITQRFGFRTHAAGDLPTNWSADENPASQSAIPNVGAGFSDDHMSLAVTSDGTVYAGVKTGYDRSGRPVIGLLVRRPTGLWDDFYAVDTDLGATRPIAVVNEAQGIVMVVYRSGAGPIVYRQAPLSNPGLFGTRRTLISGGVNNVSSTRQVLGSDAVFLATDYPAVAGSPEVVRSVRFVWPAPAGGALFTSTSTTSTSPGAKAARASLFSSGPTIAKEEQEEDLTLDLLA